MSIGVENALPKIALLSKNAFVLVACHRLKITTQLLRTLLTAAIFKASFFW
jgi:hypothetical protein